MQNKSVKSLREESTGDTGSRLRTANELIDALVELSRKKRPAKKPAANIARRDVAAKNGK